ncbi:beta-lactamase-like protein [Earliella scabrosa]|nr:beta-lactamase-like protein [Earliella scabrosa]
MSHEITVTFIGTTSGGGPTETRNCSSLVVDALGNGSLWMVDCAEGTVRQIISQPTRQGQPRVRLSRVSKIFITHMHADHTMGTLTFLRNVLGSGPPTSTASSHPPPNRRGPQVEIYGPRGIRRMIRTLWHTTHTHSEHSFAVHELLFPGEQPSVAADVQEQDSAHEADVRRESECVGRDFHCGDDGFWRSIFCLPPKHSHVGITVDAGPILHRDPCIGYIIREVPPMPVNQYFPLPRKLVILGDTNDPSPIIPLIHDDPVYASSLPATDSLNTGHSVRIPVTLLVHEATDAFIPAGIDPDRRTGKNRTKASVEAKAIERGHSTPAMAGAFARRIGAERLIMNHIGARFQAANPNHRGPQAKFRSACIREIERQAAEAWNPGGQTRPQVAWDYLSVVLRPNPVRGPQESNARGLTPLVGGHIVVADVEAPSGDPDGDSDSDVQEVESLPHDSAHGGRGRATGNRARGSAGVRGRGAHVPAARAGPSNRPSDTQSELSSVRTRPKRNSHGGTSVDAPLHP